MNCIVNNNDFPGLTGVEVAANRRPTLTTTSHPPSFRCRFAKRSILDRYAKRTAKGILRKTDAIN